MGNYFPDEIIEDIKDRNDIVNVISGYIPVLSTGGNYKALCPFHREKTPSFMINPHKKIFKCFGCGEGGNVINFVMKMENLDFVDAIKLLAKRANISLEDFQLTEADRKKLQLKQQLYDVNKEAAIFFYKNAKKYSDKVITYLKKRGIKEEVMKAFGLGYAADSWDDLLNYLLSKGYKTETLLLSGLIIEKKENDGFYNRFRNRIMYPIFDVRGNVIAFGGRVLDDSLPKYLNSPETLVFNKSETLYGLNIARKYLQEKKLILVEGYMDVIALHQNGFFNTVAALGTSLTKGHALLLKKYCDEVIISFDGDAAGEKATLKALDVFQEVNMAVRILKFPKGFDPDQYIQHYGKFQFKEQLNDALSLIDYKITTIKNKHNLNQPEGKIKFVKELVTIMKAIKSPVEREVYIKKIENETGISKEIIQLEILGNKGQKPPNTNHKYTYINKRDNKYIEALTPMEDKGHRILEMQIIKFMIFKSNIIPSFKEKLNTDDFSIKAHRIMVDYIFNAHNDDINVDNLREKFPGFTDNIQEITQTDIDHIDIEITIKKYINNIKKYKLSYQIKMLQLQQKQLLSNKKLNKEEVENNLLKIGIQIMDLNTEIQKLQL